MEKLDNIHINFREAEGYNKAFNFVISEREAGKTTEFVHKLFNIYKNEGTALIIRRRIVDITSAYITSLELKWNQYFSDTTRFEYNKGQLKDGIVYLYVVDKSVEDSKKLLAVLIGLSCEVSRVKSLVLPDVKAIFFDEFICNPKFKEKYLENEADKFKELYNTFYRECKEMLKCWFMGNPYSHYNPYFLWLGVNTAALKKGVFMTGSNWLIWPYNITEELRKYILSRNPLYQFDDAYTRYAFFGQAVCDENIKIIDMPKNYTLEFVFKHEGKYIGVYKNKYIDNLEDKYFCKFEETVGSSRTVYCFNFDELVTRCALISRDDKMKFSRFKRAMQLNKVAFSAIATYYLIIDIYSFI